MGSPRKVESVPLTTMRSRVALLIGHRRGAVAGLAVSSVVSAFAEAGTLAVVAQVATDLAGSAKHAEHHLSLLNIHAGVTTLLWIALALSAFRLLLQFPLSILPARIVADVQADLRTRLFHSFSNASWEVQSQDREGQLQEVMTSQVMQATGGALQATSLISTGLTFIVMMVSAFALNARAAVIVLVGAVGMFALLRPLRSLGVARSRSLSKAQVEYAGGIAEANRVAEETQVFGVAGAQRSRIDHLIATAQGLFYKTQVIAKLVPNLYQSLIYLLVVAFLFYLHSSGSGHIASLGAVVLILLRAGTNGQQLQANYQGLSQSMPFIERTQDNERRYSESRPVNGDDQLPSVEAIAFEDVCFAYRPGTPVLREVSFEVAGGEAIGVIGPSGAGKSTLVQILLQLRVPSEGRYLINGTPVGAFSRESWHRLVAYVPQDPRLIHATVAENIRYFRDIPDEDVERAARLARIHDDVMSWSDGYETIVGPRADAVSGGQQQRICLARALAARPEVLVLDEPTSALDPHSENLIQESLTALRSELTLFIVAHRMSTLDMCDRVMVIDGGTMVAFDTKADLQRDNGYYQRATALATGSSGEAAL